jgi:type IV secretory pathway VirB10-like protein
MKLLPLILAALALTVVSGLSQAEIYKWKDKDGKMRYSDTPPPSNVKQESMTGKKKVAAPTSNAPLSPVENPATAAAPAVMPRDVEPPRSAEDAAAEQRQRNAEVEKNNKKEKEAQAKLKAENCIAAKANMQTYTQGGRVYKMNEKGEREYMDEKAFAEGKAKAQQEIRANC